jgi:hypothetical protein
MDLEVTASYAWFAGNSTIREGMCEGARFPELSIQREEHQMTFRMKQKNVRVASHRSILESVPIMLKNLLSVMTFESKALTV